MTRSSTSRELGAAVLACVVGSGLLLLTGGPAWGRVTLVVGEGIPVVPVSVPGRDLAPLAVGLGLCGMAAVAGLVATRGRWRQVVGAIVAIIGLVAAVDAGGARVRLVTVALESAPGAAAGDIARTAWPWLAMTAGVVLAAGGLITLVRGGRWGGMSSRYEAPGRSTGRQTRPPPDEHALADSSPVPAPGSTEPPPAADTRGVDPDAAWRALDRGEDPTVR